MYHGQRQSCPQHLKLEVPPLADQLCFRSSTFILPVASQSLPPYLATAMALYRTLFLLYLAGIRSALATDGPPGWYVPSKTLHVHILRRLTPSQQRRQLLPRHHQRPNSNAFLLLGPQLRRHDPTRGAGQLLRRLQRRDLGLQLHLELDTRPAANADVVPLREHGDRGGR